MRVRFPALRLLGGPRIRVEAERGRVDAVAQACRRGAVVKDMPQVRLAHGAANLRAPHKEAAVLFGLDVMLVDGRVEARPARARVVLRLRAKERRAASYTVIDTFFFVFPVFTRKGPLGTLLPRDPVLFGSKLPTPFLFCFTYFL